MNHSIKTAGMSNADYHNHPAVGSSRLKLMAVPARFAAAIPVASTAALRFGSVFHAWVEGKPIHITGLDCQRRSKEDRQRWSDFFSGHGADGASITDRPAAEWDDTFTAQTGKIIASQAQIASVGCMATSISASPEAMACLTGGQAELSIFWTDLETGIDLKCRPDHLNPLFCGELKTAADASERGFQGAVMRYGYHISAAMYLDGIRQARMGIDQRHRFVVVEKLPPYLCAVYQLSDAAIAVGHAEYRRLLHLLAECRQRNEWPGLPGNLELDLPVWAYNDDITDNINLEDSDHE